MQYSTTFGIRPFLARLPRTLALIVLLSLIWQIDHPSLRHDLALPPVSLSTERWVRLPRRRGTRPRARFHWGSFLTHHGLRLLAREGLLLVLLHTSGWLVLTPWSQVVLLLPWLQTLGAMWVLSHPGHAPRSGRPSGSASWQRAYQLTLCLLCVSSVLPLVSHWSHTPTGLLLPVGLGTWVTPSEIIPEQHLEAWKLSSDNRVRGSEASLRNASNESRMEELVHLVDQIPSDFYKMIQENVPAVQIIRKLIRLYREKLVRARGIYVESGQPVPPEVDAVIRHLNRLGGIYPANVEAGVEG